MTTVVATGTFTILHPGHLKYLEEAKKLGNRLVVIVARDSVVEKRKQSCVIPESQRLEIIRALRVVDEAILGDKADFLNPIRKINPDIIAIGKDQDFDEKNLQETLRKNNLPAKVVRIPTYWDSGVHSSRHIISRIRECTSK